MFLVLAVTARADASACASPPARTRSWCSSSSPCWRCSSCSASPRSTRTTSRPFFVEGEGIGGTVTAATLIFFAYIGFDAVSTSSEEVKEPEARPADRDHRLARHRDDALHPRRRRRHRRAAVRQAQGPGRAAGDRAERGRRLRLGRQHHLLRRARRHHQRRADAALRPVADPVRDEPRRPDAAAASRKVNQKTRTPVLHHRRLRRGLRARSPPSCRSRRSSSSSTSARCSRSSSSTSA